MTTGDRGLLAGLFRDAGFAEVTIRDLPAVLRTKEAAKGVPYLLVART